MRYICLFLFIILAKSVFAFDDNFNSDEWWARLPIEHQPVYNNIQEIDTSIIVITNRILLADTNRYMSEYKGKGELHYLFVYTYKGQWHVLLQKNLSDALNKTPDLNNDWVIYTEGMGKIFTSGVNRGMMMSSQYNVNVMLLDYPSITTTKSMIGNYFFAIKNARHAYEDFYPVIKNVKSLKESGQFGEGNLSLFFHSMGNYLLREIAKRELLQSINTTKWVDNLIINAACIAEQDHADWLSNIKFADNIYIQYNPKDKVLKGAEIAALCKQLGRYPQYPIVTKAHYVNFNDVAGEGHSYFLSIQGRTVITDAAYQYYNVILHGEEVNLADSNHFKISDHKQIGVSALP